ncbi:hypothetical protein [Xinfangfangia pollutisoli]|uniref:hypothetical protein n=1 Tax=Xinfangfangia pollutisoli TaxID=2865960 RepID=UPI001CD54DB3|nr:hypothetical protein [Xinfangfangia pollutisoli]
MPSKPRPDLPPSPPAGHGQRLRHRRRARLDRQFARLRRSLPWIDGWIAHLQSDRAALIRLPVALLLTLGGLLWFLPILGLWMLPAGLFLLAIDIPALQAPVSAWSIRARRWWARRRRAWRR